MVLDCEDHALITRVITGDSQVGNDILNSLLDIPVSVLDPMAGVRGCDDLDPDPRLEVATGLALRGLVGDE